MDLFSGINAWMNTWSVNEWRMAVVVVVLIDIAFGLLLAKFQKPYTRPRALPQSRGNRTSSAKRTDSPSDNGLGLTVGAGGVSPHLGLGDDVGIDLKDGSLTIGSGPVQFDMNEGLKIKLF